MKFRGGEFSTGTTGNFQPELTCASPKGTLIARLWKPKSGFGAIMASSNEMRLGILVDWLVTRFLRHSTPLKFAKGSLGITCPLVALEFAYESLRTSREANDNFRTV